MNSSICLDHAQQQKLLHIYRSHADPQVRFRAHIVLLLAGGHPWSLIAALLFCSSATIARWSTRYQQQGCDGLIGRSPGRLARFGSWSGLLVQWALEKTPQAFGFLRSRWTCAVLAVVLWEERCVQVSAESVRRMLHKEHLVWRRPRPVLPKEDPHYAEKIRKIIHLLAHLPEDETAVFEDEASASTNPDVGSMWMRQGEQAELETPGNQQKIILAGSLSWRSGAIHATHGTSMNADLFIAHLEELRRRNRRYRKIHVICDNAKFHDSSSVRDYLLKHCERLEIHWLPKYSPQTNPIERVWWHLRDEVTRCHHCFDKTELQNLIYAWLKDRSPFGIETSLYDSAKAA
jgi:transposase